VGEKNDYDVRPMRELKWRRFGADSPGPAIICDDVQMVVTLSQATLRVFMSNAAVWTFQRPTPRAVIEAALEDSERAGGA